MEVYTKDFEGNIITSPRFVQWDTGQKIYISDWDCDYDKDKYETPVFHFGNRNSIVVMTDVAEYITEDGKQILEGNIPDVLLREPYPINVYIYLSEKNANSDIDKSSSVENDKSDLVEPIPAKTFIENSKSDLVVATPSKTVFIATLEVEPRLPTDNGKTVENLEDSGITLTELKNDINELINAYNAHLENEVVGIVGEKGEKGDPFVYEDFTSEQLAALKGDKGDPFVYEDFTSEQLAALKGDKGDTPVKGVDYFTEAEKQVMVQEMAAEIGSVNTLPDYWQEHLLEKVPIIRSAIQITGRNKSAFLFYSDSHWDGSGNSKQSPTLLKYLIRHTPINKVIFGGDIVSTESTTDSGMAYLYDSWRNTIRDLPYHHSVVGNHDDGNATNNMFSKDYVYAFLLAPEESNDRVDGSGLYYYIDDKCEKTRYLYLDTAYQDAYALSEDQARFIVDSLTNTLSGWHIVVIAHCWFEQDYTNFPTVNPSTLTATTTKVLTLLSAYNKRESGTLDAISYDFTATEGKVEFCIGGHLHNDYETWESGIPIILCEADTMHNRNGSVSTEGTITEQAITAVISDYKNGCVRLVRIGRGSDRVISLKGSSDTKVYTINVSTTNCVSSGDNLNTIETNGTAILKFVANDGCILPSAVSVSGASYAWDKSTGTLTLSAPVENVSITVKAICNVLKAVGYKENKRLASDGTERDHVGSDITGLIPAKPGDYLYLKNVAIHTGGVANYDGGMFYYDTNGVKIIGYYLQEGGAEVKEVDSDSNITKIWVDTYRTGTAYVRLSAANVDETSIITVNEPIE